MSATASTAFPAASAAFPANYFAASAVLERAAPTAFAPSFTAVPALFAKSLAPSATAFAPSATAAPALFANSFAP